DLAVNAGDKLHVDSRFIERPSSTAIKAAPCLGCPTRFRSGRPCQRDRDWRLSAPRRRGVEYRKENTMQIPLQICFRNMDASPAVEAIVREKAARLDRFFDRIVSCDVTIEAPHRRQHKGKLYRVRIDIGMPGKDVHVNQEGPRN